MSSTEYSFSGPLTPSAIDSFLRYNSQEFPDGSFDFSHALGHGHIKFRKTIIGSFPVSQFSCSFPYTYRRSVLNIRSEPSRLSELKIIKKGEIFSQHGNVTFSAGPGDVILSRLDVPEMQIINRGMGEHFQIDYILIPTNLLEDIIPLLCKAPGVKFPNKRFKLALDLFNLLHNYAENFNDSSIGDLVRVLLRTISGDHTSKDPNIYTGGVAGQQIYRIKSYILSNFSNPRLRQSDVAAQMGISERQVRRLLEHCGISFSQLLLSIRLDYAASRLTDPSSSHSHLAEVGLACGFSSYPHFSAAFKERFRCSPRAFRAESLAVDRTKRAAC